jgi:hypothetical protein
MQATPTPHFESLHPYRVKLLFFGQNRLPEQLLRQSPGSKGIWKNLHFQINDREGPADFLVVFGSGHDLIKEKISKENTLFIGSEPPAIKTYPESYLTQFDSAICSDPEAMQPKLKLSQQGYPWFCGLGSDRIKTYDEYKAEKTIPKTKLISVVCSNKQTKPGHKKRFEFVKRLKEVFGDDLDIYGSGQNYVPDKADAIRPYKYHITIENSISPHYWSEKLADAYLEGALPFYSGCPNIDHYFPPEAFRPINLEDLDSTVATIRKAIDSDLYSQSTQALQSAKLQVIDQYNLFNIIAEHIESHGFPRNTPGANFVAYPGKLFRKGPLYRLKFHLRELFKSTS